MADRLEIGNLLLDLAAAIDNEDSATLGDILTLNAYEEQSSRLNITVQHQISSAEIVIDGDSARSRTLCRGPQERLGQILYCDRFQRTDKGWRIIERVMLTQIRE